MIIEPITVNFGAENNEHLRVYVDDHIKQLENTHRTLFESDLPKWRKQYEGIPEQKSRDFPWKNASNLVVQVTATYSEMLLARVMAAIHEIAPLWPIQLWGEWKPEEQGEEQRQIIEEFMQVMGVDQRELDLYRVEYGTLHDAIRFGLGVSKDPFEELIECVVVGSESNGMPISTQETVYSGPRPEKLPYDSFYISKKAKTLKQADFKIHKVTLTQHQLEARVFEGRYDKKDVDKVKEQPDRYGPTSAQIQQEQQEGRTQTPTGYGYTEYDLMECHFPYNHDGHTYRIVYTYHVKSRTCLRKIFNFYPQNEDVFHGARLGYSDDDIRGRGFCVILGDYQEEMSQIHNQDNDAGVLNNTSIYRLDPDSKLDAQFSIFPSACVPARTGEFEVFTMGRSNAMDSINRQKLLLELVKDRAGVAPPSGGAGGGIVNPKRGIYSAMGTFAALQDGNRRTNLNVADFRYYHVSLGIWFLLLYANYGVGERAELFGERAQLLEKALENVKKKRIGISVRAATASINKEMEKQNDMMLSQLVRQHYMWVGNLLQNIGQAPPQLQEYLVKVVQAGNLLMRQLMRNFGHDDAARYIPEPQVIKELSERGTRTATEQQPSGTATATSTNVSQQSVQQTPVQEQGSNARVVQ